MKKINNYTTDEYGTTHSLSKSKIDNKLVYC